MTYSYQYARRHGYIAKKWDRNPFDGRYIKKDDGKFEKEGRKPTIRRITRVTEPGTIVPRWQR